MQHTMKFSLYSLIPLLPFLLNHLRLPTLSILCCNCICLLPSACPILLYDRNTYGRLKAVCKSQTGVHLTSSDPRYIASGRIHRKHRFLYCFVLLQCWNDVFTTQLRSERGADPQRTKLATLLLLLRDVTAYLTHCSAMCVWAIA
jgi:hypothetical protein